MGEKNGYYFDVIDYRNSRRVRAMNHETRGVYREVMDEIWVNGAIPNEPATVAALINTPPDVVLRCWPAIHECLVATKNNPDLFTSERLEQERRKRNKISKLRKQIGQVGGLVAQAKKRNLPQPTESPPDSMQAIAQPIAQANAQAKSSNTSTSTSTSTRKKKEGEPAAEVPVLSFGESGYTKLTQRQYDNLKAELNGHCDLLIREYDEWVAAAPEAKHDGVRRKDRNAYPSIKAWYRRKVAEGKIKTQAQVTRGVVL